MPVFVVNVQDGTKIAETVKSVYGEGAKETWPGLWLITDEATTKQVGEKLGIADGSKGNVFIATLTTYWGWGPKDAWEWLTLKKGPKE